MHRRAYRSIRRDVRYWHKADIRFALHMSAFGGKADIALARRRCLISDFELLRQICTALLRW